MGITKDKAIDTIMSTCKDLCPYIYYRATTGSVYIKFKDDRLRSIRIADHNGISKYRYKWNLRKDLSKIKTDHDNGIVSYYYPFSKVDAMCKHIINYNRVMINNLTDDKNYFLREDIFNKNVLDKVKNVTSSNGIFLLKSLHMLNILLANHILSNSEDPDELADTLWDTKLYACSKDPLRRVVLLYFPIVAEKGLITIEVDATDEAKEHVYEYCKFLKTYCDNYLNI